MADKIADKIAALDPQSSFFSLEFFPPKTSAGFQNLIPRLTRLAYLSPLFVCVTFSAGGTTAAKSLELAEFCHNQLSLTTCLHLTCTNVRLELIDWVLAEAKRIGIRNILALRGDEPRRREYDAAPEPNGSSNSDDTTTTAQDQFTHAVDLIRYIRRTYGDYFCIGAAAYPEGHPTPSPDHPGGIYQSPEADLPHLIEKVKAGADFIVTQLFYDAEYYTRFEALLRQQPDGIFDSIPVIPGLMPVQGWQSFSRTCKLARVSVPKAISGRLESAKGDDEAVKRIGSDILADIIQNIRHSSAEHNGSSGREKTTTTTKKKVEKEQAQGFHFYTLNLEKAVAILLDKCGLAAAHAPATIVRPSKTADTLPLHHLLQQNNHNGENESVIVPPPTSAPAQSQAQTQQARARKRRQSSTSQNRVVVDRATSQGRPRSISSDFEAYSDEFGIEPPPVFTNDDTDDAGSEDVLSISEGEGAAGREATWDDYPNGRWGDARSPAYGLINNYALHPQLSPTSALALWGRPSSAEDITAIFQGYLTGSIAANPWSEEPLSVETKLIKEQLLALNAKGWWTVASQPAVNAAKSSDNVVGWGPRRGGFVWQKPFVEMFIPSAAWAQLRAKLDHLPAEVTYLAGNAAGEFASSSSSSSAAELPSSRSTRKDQQQENNKKTDIYPVTWGSFAGKEIITPTIIEPVSFKAWQEEAFGIWREWERVFAAGTPSAKLLHRLTHQLWLVNVIGHDYMDAQRLWDILLD